MKFRLLILLLGVFWCFGFAYPIENFPNGELNFSSSAQSAYLFDAYSGRVFYKKNEDAKRAMASTTKIVTAITAIEHCADLDEKFEIDSRAVGIEGSSIYLKKGEVLSVRDLLYGLMLRSGNDCACALAYKIGGSIENFARLMNGMCEKVGVINTHFTNPHGLDDKQHYTTASDLAKLTAYALNNDSFKQIVSTKNIKIGENEYRYMTNKNRLLNSLEGCVGVKTGYTKNAGRCLVSAVEKNGMRLVCVVLNCGPMFEESAAMLNGVTNTYSSVELLSPWQYIKDIQLEDGDSEHVQAFTKRGFCYPLSELECENIHINIDLPNIIRAPIENETEVGKVEIYYKKHLIFCEKIYTLREVDSRLLRDKVKEIIDRWGV